jgi:hypothetical protein
MIRLCSARKEEGFDFLDRVALRCGLISDSQFPAFPSVSLLWCEENKAFLLGWRNEVIPQYPAHSQCPIRAGLYSQVQHVTMNYSEAT